MGKQMANLREKGKIPRNEWPKILAKYGKGETIAQIGRDYGCTAPAIRYIIKRSGMLKPATAGDGSRQQVTGRRESSTSVRGSIRTMVHASPEQILGQELRQRVGGDVAAFLVALDQAVLDGSHESIASLQEATDRLMRSTARTRLELDRLLSPRDTTETREHGRRTGESPQGSA